MGVGRTPAFSGILGGDRRAQPGSPKHLDLNAQFFIERYQSMLSNQLTQTLRELRAEQEHRMSVIEG